MKSLVYAWIAALLVILTMLPVVHAQTWVPVGTATGGVAVYFNDTNEVPTNVSYLRVQYANSTTNVNGAWIDLFWPFSDPALFNDLGQYGLDLIAVAPTNTNPSPPVLYAYDWDGATPVQNGAVLWAMNDYKPGSGGPTNPSNSVYNSTLRGTSGTPVSFTLTPLGGGSFRADFAAILDSDGLIHWYNPIYPDAPILYPFTGKFLVTGSLIYDKNQDTTPGMDFYAGTMNLYAQAIPDAATVTLFGTGLLPLAALLRRRTV